jgi:hypothetical protein
MKQKIFIILEHMMLILIKEQILDVKEMTAPEANKKIDKL